MKFVLLVETSLVFICTIGSFPFQHSLYSFSFVKFPIKLIVRSNFFAQAVINIALEASCICNGL